jgi:hypothetical protein
MFIAALLTVAKIRRQSKQNCRWVYKEIWDMHLATQEAETRKITVQDQPRQWLYLKNTQHKKGLSEWFKW